MSSIETTRKAVVKRATEASTDVDTPILLVSTSSTYNLLYNDEGTSSDMDVSIYRATPPAGYFIIGDYAQGDYNPPNGVSEVVMAVNDDPMNPLLKSPLRYVQVWNDNGSGGDRDGSIWYPVPPSGYVSLGFVAQNGYNPPLISNYRCVREDLVHRVSVGALIWNDVGSGSDLDVSVYAEQNASDCFVAQGNYNPYTGVVYALNFE